MINLNKIEKFKTLERSPRLPDLLYQASCLAFPKKHTDERFFWIGAVGVRNDGAIVKSTNIAVNMSFKRNKDFFEKVPNTHAEGRVLRKLGTDGIIYVARVSREDGKLVMARPCKMCANRCFGRNVKKVFYTIDESHYGIFFPKSQKDTIYRI